VFQTWQTKPRTPHHWHRACIPRISLSFAPYVRAVLLWQSSKHDVYERLMEKTNGRGPDRGIDAVGSEAH
jgi:hypothetical protein